MRLDRIDSLPAYLESFRQEITARVQHDAQPLHDPATDAPHPDLILALRKPYPAQAHAITALVKTLKTETGTYVCGEMGTGKTLIGSFVPWILRKDTRTDRKSVV